MYSYQKQARSVLLTVVCLLCTDSQSLNNSSIIVVLIVGSGGVITDQVLKVLEGTKMSVTRLSPRRCSCVAPIWAKGER